MPIYHQSSAVMVELGDDCIHAVITSPPYPMIEKWGYCFSSQGAHSFDDMHTLLEKVWRECFRVMISGGIIAINIGDATRTTDGDFQCFPNFAKTCMLLKEIGFTLLIPVLWKKISNRPNAYLGSGFLPVSAYVSQDCEYIIIARKGSLRKFNKIEAITRKESAFSMEERNIWFSQIWTVPGKKGSKDTSGWPDEIFYRLMRMFTIRGDTILDPFCGPGNEKLANTHGRTYIGYEIKESS